MKRSDYFARWSELHGGADVSGVVKGWLIISYALAKPLVKVKVSANVLSLFGVVAAVFTYT